MAERNDGARVLGAGWAVPKTIRRNDDPVFAWLRDHPPPGPSLFTGYRQRRVLSDGESLLTILEPAARKALADADCCPDDIDVLLGIGSVPEYGPPNTLSALHAALGLPPRCWVLPQAGDFSNFNASLLLADALIASGRARRVLIAIGTNWSRHVDYRKPESVSAGDGAAAFVVGRARSGWRVADHEVLMATGHYGEMTMAGQPLKAAGAFSAPRFAITPAGYAAFGSFGGGSAPAAVTALLARNRLHGRDIALVSHQASTALTKVWRKAIAPREYPTTLPQFANMTAASIPVTLAKTLAGGRLTSRHIVLFALGPDMHAHALLLRR